MKHGHRHRWSPTYNTWRAMKARCLNPNHENYKFYGAKGVSIHQAWMDFSNFLADMGERPKGKTLDRIDPHGNYCPENCRWADRTIQGRNKRREK